MLLVGCTSRYPAHSSASLGLDPKKDEQITVSCSGTVVTYTQDAIYYHFEGGGFARGDETVIQINAPKQWAGHQLRVRSLHLPADHPLTKQGLKLEFKIPKDYLVHEYHFPGDGTIEILETK